MNTNAIMNLLLALGYFEYNFPLYEVAEEAGLDNHQIARVKDYQAEGVCAYLHYLDPECREKFVDALLSKLASRYPTLMSMN